VHDYLEVAAWYHRLDDPASAEFVLGAALKDLPNQARTPLVYYYLASEARRQGRNEEASNYAAKAVSAPVEKVFPGRVESAQVLLEAIQTNPRDAHAKYFLGNFFFANGQYERAAELWHVALSEGFRYSVLGRNLGLYAWLVLKDLSEAARYFESAIQLAPDDYRLYRDLEDIYFQLGDVGRGAQLLAAAPASVLARDAVAVRLARLLVQQRKYEQALQVLTRHQFHPGDGREMNREVYVLANIEWGRLRLQATDFRQAERYFRQATEYPLNLGMGKPVKPRDAEAYYWLGKALQLRGDIEEARRSWEEAITQGERTAGPPSFFQALALEELGKRTLARRTFDEILAAAAPTEASGMELYVAGLVERYRNRADASREKFRLAAERDPALWQASFELHR
jgi:tetratricopeptide (TPR) repeat protein